MFSKIYADEIKKNCWAISYMEKSTQTYGFMQTRLYCESI
jgi:hypothetical protein